MTAIIMDGRVVADEIYKEVSAKLEELKKYWTPRLAVVLVGNDPASQLYVDRKRKVCARLGIDSSLHVFPEDVSELELASCMVELNGSAEGLLVQLPLPSHIDKHEILNLIDPCKDVDCLNIENVGKLIQGNAVLKPCTPAGILEILKYYKITTAGKRVTIINRSDLVGKPLALILQQEPYNATVTICHEYTKDLFLHTLHSDIIITAVGKYPTFILPLTHIPCGAVVIDVAINRVDGKVFGDVEDFEAAKTKVSYITPVPGGVGKTTLAMLMKNTILCSQKHHWGSYDL